MMAGQLGLPSLGNLGRQTAEMFLRLTADQCALCSECALGDENKVVPWLHITITATHYHIYIR